MALTTAEVTAVSRNTGTRRIREDTQGHEQGANQVQEDTGGPEGKLKDTSRRRFGTMRPRVQIPGPRPISSSKIADFRSHPQSPGHSRGTESPRTPLDGPRYWPSSLELNSCGSDRCPSACFGPADARSLHPSTVRHWVRKIAARVHACSLMASPGIARAHTAGHSGGAVNR
jgi:hypothetical protein